MMGKLPCQQKLGFLALTHEGSQQCENFDRFLQPKANLGKLLKEGCHIFTYFGKSFLISELLSKISNMYISVLAKLIALTV